jgi:hypothetical protein
MAKSAPTPRTPDRGALSSSCSTSAVVAAALDSNTQRLPRTRPVARSLVMRVLLLLLRVLLLLLLLRLWLRLRLRLRLLSEPKRDEGDVYAVTVFLAAALLLSLHGGRSGAQFVVRPLRRERPEPRDEAGQESCVC